MGRPIYNYELSDPDFSWLINSYKENNPKHTLIDSSGIPVSFLSAERELKIIEATEILNEEFDNQTEPVNCENKEDNIRQIK